MDKSATAQRKRQQIGRANKMMFVWIAGVSVIVGISIVLTIFLVQKIWYGEKVIAAKEQTVKQLDKNLNNVDSLKDEIRVLNTNENLSASRQSESDSPLQPILDALPADANPTALASSLQTKLLTGVSGVVVETLNVEPVSSDEGGDSVSTIDFNFSVSTDAKNYAALKEVLERVEKSIRPINITTLSVAGQGNRLLLTVSGESYYKPAKKVQLSDKVVKP